jgi:phosphoenolpyruvate synthase/pyruvate phosphate dikinase
MKYILPFQKITKSDSPIFGGKVASLGEMFQANIPVPNGFGISIEAHRTFKDKPFSDEFNMELHTAFRLLKCKRVAVRSSAVAEDASDASWAGQLESYLNVTNGCLEQAIRDCWSSVEATHVKEYAKDKNLGVDSLLVGVAVQQMVDSEVAGVMFTTNPVTGDANEVLIEGAYGLGEMVVQGIVTPDNFRVSKKLGAVTHFGIQIKEKMMIYKDGRNITLPVPENQADRAVLRENQVLELANIGLGIAKHYSAPQDIEWALYKDKFYIVQSRPITTLG